jgi:hypothetical protein
MMSKRVEGIRDDKVIDTLIFDHLIEDLQRGFKMLCRASPRTLRPLETITQGTGEPLMI